MSIFKAFAIFTIIFTIAFQFLSCDCNGDSNDSHKKDIPSEDVEGDDSNLPLDSDGDGVDDSLDNCASIENSDQLDSDSDGIGDACEIYDGEDDGNGDQDTLAPQNPSIIINNGDSITNRTNVILSLSVTDDVGVIGYYLLEASTTLSAPPTLDDTGWILVSSTTNYIEDISFNISSGDGLKTIYVWFKDASGNISIEANDSITLALTCDTGAICEWGADELIEDNAGLGLEANTPQIAIDLEGNAIAVWTQNSGADLKFRIHSNRYTNGVGWSGDEIIENIEGNFSFDPQIEIDSEGNGIAIWFAGTDPINTRIYSSRYTKDIGWGDYEVIDNNGGNIGMSPQLAIDSEGNAIAVWIQNDITMTSGVFSNIYLNGIGWGDDEMIEDNIGNPALEPQIAIDSEGNAIAVWSQSDGSNYRIFSNRYIRGTVWGDAELIEDNAGNDAYSPQIAIDSEGNAIAVWQQFNGLSQRIYSNRYTNGVGWGEDELIEDNEATNLFNPQIAIDNEGNAIAVWASDPVNTRIYSNRYVNGVGWGEDELVDDNEGYNAFDPQISFDSEGNAILVWMQNDGTNNRIYANRYTKDIGWGDDELIEDNAADAVGYDATTPQIAIDSEGNAIAIWAQRDETNFRAYSNRYTKQ